MSTPHKPELAVPVTAIDHAQGADHAPVTLVEYGDFECLSVKQAAPLLKLLLERRPGKLRVVFRHYPLEGVHPHALLAAQAAEAAAAQGRFWQMHDLLFTNQMHLKICVSCAATPNSSNLDMIALQRRNRRRGLPAARARADRRRQPQQRARHPDDFRQRRDPRYLLRPESPWKTRSVLCWTSAKHGAHLHLSRQRHRRHPQHRRLRGVPGDGRHLGPPAPVPRVRSRRLLRRLEKQARDQALSRPLATSIITSLEPGEDWSWCYVDSAGHAI